MKIKMQETAPERIWLLVDEAAPTDSEGRAEGFDDTFPLGDDAITWSDQPSGLSVGYVRADLKELPAHYKEMREALKWYSDLIERLGLEEAYNSSGIGQETVMSEQMRGLLEELRCDGGAKARTAIDCAG